MSTFANSTTFAAFALACCTVVGLGIGCSSSSGGVSASDAGAAHDSGSVADAGPSADGGAGVGPDVGRLLDNGGPKLTAAKIVTVVWSADPSAATIEAFTDKLGASSYWKDTLGEYGIGAATAKHVRVTDAPVASYTTDALEMYIAQQIAASATSGWPAYDASTVYAVFLPQATKLDPVGCYHGETQVGADQHVPFVVIDPFDNGSRNIADALTQNAGHEIEEAVTNPHVFSDLGLVNFDAPHIAWNMLVSDPELGDICEETSDAYFAGPADLPYPLQRMWSNKSAAAGHNPCVPAPAEPYYGVTPLALETVSVFVDTASTPSVGLGYRVPIGTQKTIKVGFFSDKPVATPWTITAVEGNFTSPATNHRLTITTGKGSGKTGDTDTITVTANAMSLGAGNAVLLTVTSQAPGLPSHATPILIGTY